MTATGYIITWESDGFPRAVAASTVASADDYTAKIRGGSNVRRFTYPDLIELLDCSSDEVVDAEIASAVSDTKLRRLVVEWADGKEGSHGALLCAAQTIEQEDKPEDPRIKVLEKYLLDHIEYMSSAYGSVDAAEIIAKLDKAAT